MKKTNAYLLIQYILYIDYAQAFNKHNCNYSNQLNNFFHQNDVNLTVQDLTGKSCPIYDKVYIATMTLLRKLLVEHVEDIKGESFDNMNEFFNKYLNTSEVYGKIDVFLSDNDFNTLSNYFDCAKEQHAHRWACCFDTEQLRELLVKDVFEDFRILHRKLNGKRATGNARVAEKHLNDFFGK